MRETILIARDRKTGKDVILADRSVSFPEQRAKYREFNGTVNEEYDRVALVYLDPCKKPLKFITAEEQQARAKKHEAELSKEKVISSGEAREALAKAEAEKETAGKAWEKSKQVLAEITAKINSAADSAIKAALVSEKKLAAEEEKQAKAVAREANRIFQEAKSALIKAEKATAPTETKQPD